MSTTRIQALEHVLITIGLEEEVVRYLVDEQKVTSFRGLMNLTNSTFENITWWMIVEGKFQDAT